MRHRRFQNIISTSTITLPLSIVMGILVWFWDAQTVAFRFSAETLVSLLLCLATLYVLTETANAYSLLRVRTLMTSSVWMASMALMPFTHSHTDGMMAALSIAGSIYVMLRTYQKHEPVVDVFHTFLLLGCATIALPELVVLVPCYYWYLLVFMRSLSWRSIWAGVVGLALPPSFLLGWSILAGELPFFRSKAEELFRLPWFRASDYASLLQWHNPLTLHLVLVSLLSACAIVHFLRTYCQDKIRTRMQLYVLTMQTLVCWLLVLCLPSRFALQAPVLMLSACALIAHFFTLTSTILSNLFFCLTLLASAALLALNLGLWTL